MPFTERRTRRPAPGQVLTFRSMDIALSIALAISAASVLAWGWLLLGRGFFWRTSQRLAARSAGAAQVSRWPVVSVVVPARNEADILPCTLPALLKQECRGDFHVFLVDDQSSDSTAEAALKIARQVRATHRLTVIRGRRLEPGWTGKLWALQQGVWASALAAPEFLLFTDADIAHPLDSLQSLAGKAQAEDLDLVSVMAHLPVATFWDRLLIPAFVFFFAKLYPFRWANDPQRSTAAAAGGCLLVRREALERAGGLAMVAGALIDDCALARLVKEQGRSGGGKTWLGLSRDVRSLRPYLSLGRVWGMVARTAFTQLRYSPLLLAGTVLGMALVYLAPPLSVAGGLVAGALGHAPGLGQWLVTSGLVAWVLMAGSYLPMLKWYRVSPLFAFLLPLTAALYTLMTVDSARRHWRGTGGAWKGRTYARRLPGLEDPD